MSKPKIALCLIAKSSEEEAVFLRQCLDNIRPFVDGVFVTATYRKGQRETTNLIEHELLDTDNVSFFEWENDFAKARNFNFSQVPKEYEYIIWSDCDDVFRGLENMRKMIEDNSDVDAFAFNYLYAFDKWKNPTVVHKKTQLVRNDGSMKWVGRLHEDLQENRSLNVKFVSFIERMHMTTDEHAESARIRNVEISEIEAKENPNDPKMSFNLGNSYFGAGMYDKARGEYTRFLETSQSNDEKYVIHQRLSAVEKSLGNRDAAIGHLLTSIGLMYELPDAYNNLGYLYFDYGNMDEAERYLLKGLTTKPQYHRSIVYNPRDYDYNPMMGLAKVYFNKARPDLALPMLKGCAKIYPRDESLKDTIKDMERENDRLAKVITACEAIEKLDGNLEKIKHELSRLDHDMQSHPAICRIRNKYFVKTESTGRDITYYCGQTSHEWNPEMAKTKGIGGSEEAVINLSKEWAKMGYNVTVYNSCGNEPMTCDGVRYEPFWAYNAKDKTDITILWRRPNLADYDLNTGKLFVDVHDVIPAGEFTEKRLAKIDKVMVKTNFHRSLFPNVPDEKISVIGNGMSLEGAEEVEKDPYLIINTSSPDRSMGAVPKLFKEIKKRVPQARMAWAYGWEIFDNAHRSNKTLMEWKDKCINEMEEAGIENLGRLSQAEVGKLYQKASIFFYPTHFAEIHCISVCKAQAANCFPVTTDFAALGETNVFGSRTHSKKDKDTWCKPYQIEFSVDDEEEQKELVENVVKQLTNPKRIDGKKLAEWSKDMMWDNTAKSWLS
jgi:tetratricopeptide (TPR) repeat protein/glycosyltransferase involved in cell wall biosynthesis